MKSNLFTLSLIVLVNLGLHISISAQTIRRVNTMPGLTDPTVYETIQAAHDASVAGDIIYVEPANNGITTYPDVVINRRITLIGTGFNLAINTGTSADKRQVGVGNITLDNGSNGSKITGLTIGQINVKDANCKIERNAIGGIELSAAVQQDPLIVLSDANNTMIYNNIISGSINGGYWVKLGYIYRTTTNCIITNNIILSNASYPYGSTIIDLTGAVISKNIMTAFGHGYFSNINGSSLSANIFDTRGWQSAPFSLFDRNLQDGSSRSNGNTLSNNLCTTVAVLPAGNGNVNSADAASVFKVADPFINQFPYPDSNFELSPTSPALTVGTGGTPIGAFSGNTPYVLSGLPNIPIITDFSINNVGNTNSPLQVNVKARSNN